jgi:micrococcal nuclease
MRAFLLVLVFLVFPVGCAHADGTYKQVRIFDCSGSKMTVDDGDTLHCGDERIRIMGIDTPETKHPAHGFMEDQPYGPEATLLAKKILEPAKVVTIVAGGTDIYGRTLGHVLVDGVHFGAQMVAAGLAYETISKYGDSGFAGFAALILEAARNAPELKFENPHDWRKKKRKAISK